MRELFVNDVIEKVIWNINSFCSPSAAQASLGTGTSPLQDEEAFCTALLTAITTEMNNWVLDSRAAQHMTVMANTLTDIRPCNPKIQVAGADILNASHLGSATLTITGTTGLISFKLYDILVVTDIDHKLSPSPKSQGAGHRVIFDATYAENRTKEHKFVAGNLGDQVFKRIYISRQAQICPQVSSVGRKSQKSSIQTTECQRFAHLFSRVFTTSLNLQRTCSHTAFYAYLESSSTQRPARADLKTNLTLSAEACAVRSGNLTA